jgi:hypothetical protein
MENLIGIHKFDDGGYRVEEWIYILNAYPTMPSKYGNPLITYLNKDGQIKQDSADKIEIIVKGIPAFKMLKGTRKPLIEVNPPLPEPKEAVNAEQNKSANTETAKGT